MEDTVPKNIATSLKSDKFLAFFFSRLKSNSYGEHEEYPFISPCGKEMNFIKCADTPLVFQELKVDTLIYSPGLSVPFQPSSLRVSPTTGRLYHAAPVSRKSKGYAVLKSHLGIQISQYLEDDPSAETGLCLHYQDERTPILYLTPEEDCGPTKWSR